MSSPIEEELDALLRGEAVRFHKGFPNAAADRSGQHRALTLDLNLLLIQNASSTYLFRISGNSWAAEGILDGDIAVINRALTPRPTDLVLVWENDVFWVSRSETIAHYPEPWGVITSVIHILRGRE